MKRPKLTYSNVMATIAVFIALGGSAYAATQLKKNSVGTRQLRKNSVTTAKIKNGAVTTSKIVNGAVTGAQVNLGSLGTVPSANESDATNGMHLGKLDFLSGENVGPVKVFSADGLTLTAQCVTHDLEFTATTSVPYSEIYESGNYKSTYKGDYNDEFMPGDVEEVGKKIGDGGQDEVQGQLVYSTPGGAVVTAQFSLNEFTLNAGLPEGCAVKGTAEFS